MMNKKYGTHTQVVHAGKNPDSEHGSVAPPIYQTSTFKFDSAEQGRKRFSGEESGYIYSRLGNPTTDALEGALADLEHGVGALVTSTGMSAVTTMYFSLLDAGDHMVGSDCMYGPARVVMEKEFSRKNIASDFLDTSNLDAVRKAIKPNTKLIYIETPANPTLKITDIAACAKIAHEHGALLAVDSTFLSPVLQNPIDLGADIVIHSMTKFINGHTDVIAGAIICKDENVHLRIRSVLRSLGGTMDPNQAWLVLRGLRTLALRMEKSQNNAMKLAEFLENHPAIEAVHYPGLKSHPQYELGQRQSKGPGAVMAFELNGGYEAGESLMNNISVALLAVSLGGYESLIQHPASMTHASIPKAERVEAGITDGLIRLSVGCEDVEDLIQDFDRALG
ncbi:MAG: PLP-dependent transferase [Candidatus Marinimicrobia bacterium]|nr:PLP-dependent transferase [Candidatus Neomarinimicrobiota bacterium]